MTSTRFKLTKSSIDTRCRPIPGKQIIYRDTELGGFGLLVGTTGTKSYVVQRDVAGRTLRRTVGRHGLLTVEQARRKAQQMLLVMADGQDPKDAARRSQLEEK